MAVPELIALYAATFLSSSLFLVGLASVQLPSNAGNQEKKPASTSDSNDAEEGLRYGRHGSMRAQPERRDEVVEILLLASEELSAAGCLLYAVSTDPDDPDLIWVTEIWESREAHAASLELPAVRQAIEQAMPTLTGEFSGSEFDVVGGLGLP